jgi:hypothetical protein
MKPLRQILFIALLIFNATYLSAQESKAVDSLIVTIDKTVAEIEAFRKQHKQNQKVFIIRAHGDKLSLEEVPDGTSDDMTEATYYLLYDEQGRLLSHTEIPTSYSGDWYREWTHYFDKDGKTLMFKHYAYHYNSGCTYLLQVTTRYYFDTQFHMIKRNTVFTDKDDGMISEPEACQQYPPAENDSAIMMPNYANIQERIEHALPLFKDRRIITRPPSEEQLKENERKWKEAEERQRLQWAQEDEELARIKNRDRIVRVVLYAILVIALVQAIRSFIRAFSKNK